MKKHKDFIRRLGVASILLLMAVSVKAQCGYCCTYEDFLAGRWEVLDTVYTATRSKSQQLWWGGNGYKITTNDKATNKILKKNAFVVKQADSLYVNCRNLRYEGTAFGNGYAKAVRIGHRSLMLVNRIIGRDAKNESVTASFLFGAIGAGITYNDQLKQQVCYVISYGADSKGKTAIRLIDDALAEQMLADHDDLLDEYYAETDNSKRLLATHLMPILEKAGLFAQEAYGPDTEKNGSETEQQDD